MKNNLIGDLTMDISKQEAQDSLDQIQTVFQQTRKKIASSYVSPFLILWGLFWTAAFLGTHFFPAWASLIWIGLCGISFIVTWWIGWRQFRSANPVKTPATEKTGWCIFWFWALLFLYIFIWHSILRPSHAVQQNAFICTAIMFAYVVMGLWFKSYYMLWLGIAVTCTTLVGFYLIPTGYYRLWMALTGGGAILGTGLYIRLFWK